MKRPKIYAHRGFSSRFPENTMLAFKEAEKLNIDGLELDVQLSKDNVPVICHDEEISRTSTGKGFIKDKCLSELKKYSFHGEFPQFTNHKDTKMPILEEFLYWVKDTELEINLELKTNVFSYKGLVEGVLELVEKYHLTSRVIISSFNYQTLREARARSGEVSCAVLSSKSLSNPGDYCKKHEISLYHPYYLGLTDEDLINCSRNDILVNTWTVDEAEQMISLAKRGVAGIFTNRPDLAVETFRE